MSDLVSQQEIAAGLITKFYMNTTKQGEKKMKSPVYWKTRIAYLCGYWKEFYSRHFDILIDPENLKEYYVVHDCFSAIGEDYTSTKSMLLIDVKKAGGLSETTKTPASSQVVVSTEYSIKHNPSSPLLKFSGDELEWETFRDMFKAMVHDNKLSDIQKLYYLRNSLSGKAADRIRNKYFT